LPVAAAEAAPGGPSVPKVSPKCAGAALSPWRYRPTCSWSTRSASGCRLSGTCR